MTRLQKIIGSSVISLLLLAVTMFTMCSVRMQRLNTDGDIDDLALFDEPVAGEDSAYQDDFLSRMEVVEQPAAQDSDFFFSDDPLASAFGSEPGSGSRDLFTDSGSSFDSFDTGGSTSTSSGAGAESFITPELLADMEKEIQDLENIYDTKTRVVDSLRDEVQQKQFSSTSPAGTTEQSRFLDELNQLDSPAPKSSTPSAPKSSSYTPPAPSPDVANTEVGMLYQDALNEYYGRRYDAAINLFSEILLRSDVGSLADNCQYWIGESYYAKGNYLQAVVEFEKVNRFPTGNKLGDAQLMVGLSYMKLGENSQARNALAVVLNFIKNATTVQKAQRYMMTIERT